MYQIAIIGAGQLGSRHLQGLARLQLPCTIHVVDPVPGSLRTARARFGEMPANAAIAAVHYHSAIDALPLALDYVIVATTANVRLSVLQSLLAHSSVRYLLLEKVLFQRADDFAAAQALLSTRQVQAWVNCPRRLFPVYKEVQQFFSDDKLLSMSVAGGGWGMACNSIHFIDLFAMLAGGTPDRLSGTELDLGYVPSKRQQFIELTGTLRGNIGSIRFEITATADSQARLLLTLRGERRSCIIDEAGGTGFFFDGQAWEQRNVRVPFMSELAPELARAILDNGVCELPSYAESAQCHLPLLAAFNRHLVGTDLEVATCCPIT